MTKSSKQELATKAAYNKRPDVQADRVDQNRARRQAITAGRAKVGDGTNVHHVIEADVGRKGGAVKVVSAEYNKAWRSRKPSNYGTKK